MKQDIQSREDISAFIHQFYDALIKDNILSHFFEKLVNSNQLDHHLEIIIDFWEDILLKTSKYGNNAMKPHLEMHKNKPFATAHFKQWLKHFNTTIDSKFDGPKATLAKTRALSIATVMQIKMQTS